jgi:hypothetical protein
MMKKEYDFSKGVDLGDLVNDWVKKEIRAHR